MSEQVWVMGFAGLRVGPFRFVRMPSEPERVFCDCGEEFMADGSGMNDDAGKWVCPACKRTED